MNTKQLVIAAIALTAVMFAAVPLLTGVWPGGIHGYFAALGLYWVLFCVPVVATTIRREDLARLLSLRLRGAVWVPVVLLGQVAVFAVYALFEGFLSLPATAIALGLAFALVNGPLEEFAWRGAYHTASPANAFTQGAGVWLFALWHIPLMLSFGVEFSLNPVLIVGSTLMLGTLWAMATYGTRSIAWPILAHILNNAIALPGLIAHNS